MRVPAGRARTDPGTQPIEPRPHAGVGAERRDLIEVSDRGCHNLCRRAICAGRSGAWRRGVKPRERCGNGIDLRRSERAAPRHLIGKRISGEAAHFHRIFDRRAGR